jgi:hypothetical protein
MPAAVLPSFKISASSASVLRTTSGLVATSGPRSPPRASSPWHDAQTLSYVALASIWPAALLFEGVVACLSWAASTTVATAIAQRIAGKESKVPGERADRSLSFWCVVWHLIALIPPDVNEFGLRVQSNQPSKAILSQARNLVRHSGSDRHRKALVSSVGPVVYELPPRTDLRIARPGRSVSVLLRT